MDYAHAQRVATGLLLRRSQTSYYRQSNGTLSTLRYFEAPLDGFGNPQRAEQVIGPPAISRLRSTSETTRVSPSTLRNVTRSLKMSFDTTFSSPRAVTRIFASFGKRFLLWT